MNQPRFKPGFRLSQLDIVVLIATILATIWLTSVTWWWGFLLAWVVGHFFLFCNFFRLARISELVWSAVFIALAAPTILANQPGWLITACISFAMTVGVVIWEMRKPSYHGVGWSWVNSGLLTWWADHPRPSVSPSGANSTPS